MLVRLIAVLIALAALVALYFAAALKWSYSSGERAGWVQNLAMRGWVCKTWEGELAVISLPGTAPEKFPFTVVDEQVAGQINKAMGKRVSLHYEQKVGLPGSCFGETRFYVTGVTVSDEVPLAPGVVVPSAAAAASAQAAQAAQAAASGASAAAAAVTAPPAASAASMPASAP
ncbi:hypothetical protein [Pseudorhodoferax sp.]|uniref:hypothetical protein n=1 Tax=Pseudorhodoferax sp. TaxID=1993553 RepID=UPI002DD6574D|nr:hypothetical protein [Pseudorhodoferax sp.]